MFDIQALAFAADITRVFSFKMGRDGSSRVYSESGSDKPFHPASHHGGTERGVKEFFLINKYHVSMLPYFLEQLKSITEGRQQPARQDDDHVRLADGRSEPAQPPSLSARVAWQGQRTARRQLHLKAPDGTPMANVMLTALQSMGMPELKSFGDSTIAFCAEALCVICSARRVGGRRVARGRRPG